MKFSNKHQVCTGAQELARGCCGQFLPLSLLSTQLPCHRKARQPPGLLNMLAPFRSRAAYSLLQMPIKCLFCARHNTKSLLKAPVPFMRLCHHHLASGKSKSFLIKRNGKKEEETCEEKKFIRNIKISSGLLILQKNRPALKPLQKLIKSIPNHGKS